MLKLRREWWAVIFLTLLSGWHCQPDAPHPSVHSAIPTASKQTPVFNDLDVELMSRQFPPSVPGIPPATALDNAGLLWEQFKDAQPFAPDSNATEELWFGRTFVVYADTTSGETFFFVRLRSQPSTSGHQSYEGFASELIVEDGKEEADARAVLNALMKGSPLPPHSPAIHYMQTAPPRGGYHALQKSTGVSLILSEENPCWLRRKNQRLLMIQKLSPKSSVSKTPYHGGGLYSELWRISESQ